MPTSRVAQPYLALKFVRRHPIVVATALSLFLAGCGKSGGAPGGAAPPPAQVGVVTVTQGDVGLVTELPGRLEASRVAQVRARAAGILQKRLFREGSDVTAGQPLFRIDSAPYAAAAASAKAGQARAEANLAQASAGRTLQTAGRGQCDQQAGIRQRRGGAKTSRSRCGCWQGQCADGQHQSGLCRSDGAYLGPHWLRTGDRRCTRRAG